jgi:hypothetical protein
MRPMGPRKPSRWSRSRGLGGALLGHVQRGVDAQPAVEQAAVAVTLRGPLADVLDEVGRGHGVERLLAGQQGQRLGGGGAVLGGGDRPILEHARDHLRHALPPQPELKSL